jgi:DNA invertase Pin-like site-specific DNA recombinase
MIAARLRAGRRHKAALGGYAGGAPRYGFRAAAGELVPDEEEQLALARVRELRDEGRSLREIGEVLDAEGLPPKRGGRWHPYGVSRLLVEEHAHG